MSDSRRGIRARHRRARRDARLRARAGEGREPVRRSRATSRTWSRATASARSGRARQLSRAQRSMITLAMLIALGRAARDPRARQGRDRERRDEGADQRDHHALGDLLRGPGGRRRLPQCDGDARRARAGVSAAPQDLRVGFVGLGNMGAPMVRNLAEAGFALTLRDANDALQAQLVGRARRCRGRVDAADFARRGRRRHDAARRSRRRGRDARVGGWHRRRAAPGRRASST